MRRTMHPFTAGILTGILLCGPLVPSTAFGAISLQIVPSWDNTRVSTYSLGDKPLTPPANCPVNWTCTSKGTGFGEINEISSSNFNFAAGGNSASNGFKYAYKDVASGDFQLKMRVNNDYSPVGAASFSGLGITISDGTGNTDVIHNIFSPNAASVIARSLRGVPGSTTGADGAVGQTRPRWLCAGYDESANESRTLESADGSTWLAVSTFSYAFSTPIVGIYAQSGSTTATLGGSVDNITLTTGPGSIDCWTPIDPTPSAPLLVGSGIPSQSGTQGVAFSLDVNPYWTGQTPSTNPYTISGLPGGTGLSLDGTSGILSGTLAANDVGSRNLTITAKNSIGNTPSTFSFTGIANTGDTFGPYSSSITEINCSEAETATKKGFGANAGDTILLAGGTRPALVVQSCAGSASSPITVKNDPSASSPTVITRQAGNSTFVLQLMSVSNLVFGPDGAGAKYSGGTAAWCGQSEATNTVSGENRKRWLEDATTACGIVVTRNVSASNVPTAYIKVGGLSTKWTLQGVEIDGLDNDQSGGSGIGISVNDHAKKERDNPGFWREDQVIKHVYIHDNGFPNGGEAIYFGPNAYGADPGDDGNDIPLRRNTIAYTLIENSSSDCLNPKYWLQGPNYIYNNHMYDCGQNTGAGNGRVGISGLDGGDVQVYGNRIDTPGTVGIQWSIGSSTCSAGLVNGFNQNEADCGPFTYEAYNNVVINPTICFNSQRGSPTAAKPGTRLQLDPINEYNNTCVNPSNADAFLINSGLTGAKAIRDNIVADTGCTGANDKITPVAAANNNRCDTIANHVFLNQAGKDYHLTVTSPARNTGTVNAPAIDFDGVLRPQEGADDQGAYEYVP